MEDNYPIEGWSGLAGDVKNEIISFYQSQDKINLINRTKATIEKRIREKPKEEDKNPELVLKEIAGEAIKKDLRLVLKIIIENYSPKYINPYQLIIDASKEGNIKLARYLYFINDNPAYTPISRAIIFDERDKFRELLQKAEDDEVAGYFTAAMRLNKMEIANMIAVDPRFISWNKVAIMYDMVKSYPEKVPLLLKFPAFADVFPKKVTMNWFNMGNQ